MTSSLIQCHSSLQLGDHARAIDHEAVDIRNLLCPALAITLGVTKLVSLSLDATVEVEDFEYIRDTVESDHGCKNMSR